LIAGSSIPRWPPKAHQPRFLSIDLQPEPGKPLRDHPLDFMNILQALETHDKVIGISHHEGFPLTRGLDGFYEPLVQHLVQIDVTEQFLGTYARLTGGAW
jgi:hypothetical protein